MVRYAALQQPSPPNTLSSIGKSEEDPALFEIPTDFSFAHGPSEELNLATCPEEFFLNIKVCCKRLIV